MSEATTTDQWVHDPQRDGAGCTWCGAFAQVDADNLCRGCFEEDEPTDSGRATLASAVVLTAIAATGAVFAASWVHQAAAMLGGVG